MINATKNPSTAPELLRRWVLRAIKYSVPVTSPSGEMGLRVLLSLHHGIHRHRIMTTLMVTFGDQCLRRAELSIPEKLAGWLSRCAVMMDDVTPLAIR